MHMRGRATFERRWNATWDPQAPARRRKPKSKGAPMIEAFGDESAGDTYVTYAYLGVAPSDALKLAGELAKVKVRAGMESHRLHCRVLFSGPQKEKAGLRDLRFEHVVDLYDDVMQVVGRFDTRRVFAWAKVSDFRNTIPEQGNFKSISFDKKSLGVWCANVALIKFSEEFGAKNVTVWTDVDKTKIDWISGRRQASQAIGCWFDHGSGPALRITPQPEVMSDERALLFEVADLIAWLEQRVLERGRSNLPDRLRRLHAFVGAQGARLPTMNGQRSGVSYR